MSILFCPGCGAQNPADAKKCWVCQASLEDVAPLDSDQDSSAQKPHDDNDLTDLLESLKQDDDLSEIPAENGEDLPVAPETNAVSVNLQGEDDEPEVPEWLNRIRQRAQTEPDSVGEITQKINAAKESLVDEKSESQHRQLEGLIQKIHGEEAEPVSEEELEVEESQEPGGEPGTVRADWLRRIRKKHRPAEPEKPEEILSEREGDSLLQWLVALEDGDEPVEDAEVEKSPVAENSAEDTQEISLIPESEDDTHEIPLEAAKDLPRKEVPLSISREEQARADQLTAIIKDENAPRPERIPEKTFFPRGLRLAIGVLLITILSFTLFLGTPTELPSAAPTTQSLAVVDWAGSLPQDALILLVLDYPAAFSTEMRLIATPVLRMVFTQGGEVALLRSAPAGRLLFDQLLADAELPEALIAQDLGYYPVGSFGAYGLAQQALQPQNQLDLFNALPFEGFAGIVIMGDDYEGAMAWIEQFSSLAPETPIFLLVSAQAGPLLLPYCDSGQVRGMISGVSDAVDLEGQTPELTLYWRAYQVGTVLMILMLLIGMSFPASHRQHVEGQDER